jgi:hypothetical protein
MLHIATVHFESPRWISIQARELRRHLHIPSQVWTSLEGIDASYGKYFDHVIDQDGPHADKLNHLALEICHTAEDDDLLMFLDGDAFPIADPEPLITSGLEKASLVAVQRVENYGDTQPHPCFCVTRVGDWKSLRGDWTKGYMWSDVAGLPVTDVGANLLRQLDLTDTPWVPLLRTNRHNPHPLFFGIYGDAVYHHGAGFRWPISRVDLQNVRPITQTDLPMIGPLARRADRIRHQAQCRLIARRNLRQAEEIFQLIQQDERSWLDRLI